MGGGGGGGLERVGALIFFYHVSKSVVKIHYSTLEVRRHKPLPRAPHDGIDTSVKDIWG